MIYDSIHLRRGAKLIIVIHTNFKKNIKIMMDIKIHVDYFI